MNNETTDMYIQQAADWLKQNRSKKIVGVVVAVGMWIAYRKYVRKPVLPVW